MCMAHYAPGEIFCHYTHCMAHLAPEYKAWPQPGDWVEFTLVRQDRKNKGIKLLAATD